VKGTRRCPAGGTAIGPIPADRGRGSGRQESHHDPKWRRHGPGSSRARDRISSACVKCSITSATLMPCCSAKRDLAVTLGRVKIGFQLRIELRQVKRPLTDADLSWARTEGKDYKLEYEEIEAEILEIDTWLPGGPRRSWQDTWTEPLESMADDIATTIMAAFALMAEGMDLPRSRRCARGFCGTS